MAVWVDRKYARMLGEYLEQFREINDSLYNFRCNVCGDSKHNKTKTRGYIYKIKDKLNVKCHNCGYSASLGTFLKYVDNNLYSQYVIDNMQDRKQITVDPIEKLNRPVVIKDSNLKGLQRLDTLALNHSAINYVISRKIPRAFWKLLYYTDTFMEYINSIEKKFTYIKEDYPRLIIPFFNEEQECFAISARAFGKEEPKYFNMKLKEDVDNIFGLDRVNKQDIIYCVEGPLDSLFLPNGIAVTGTTFNKQTIQDLKQNLVIIPDREPRSAELVKVVENLLKENYTISLLPESFIYKDINEAVMNGLTTDTILNIVKDNTVSGITAQLKFRNWRKC